MTPQATIVARVQERWSAAFAQRDLPRLVSLYTADALFYGSKAELFRGHDGVHRYFAGLSPAFKRARFAQPALIMPTPQVIAASGPVVFEAEDAGPLRLLSYRMTHILVDQRGDWLIATHHASPAPDADP